MGATFITEFLLAEVAPHAIQRWKERTGAKGGEEKIARRLRNLLARAEEVKLKRKYRLKTLCTYRGQEARYFLHDGQYIFVVTENRVLRTVHTGTADRWEAA